MLKNQGFSLKKGSREAFKVKGGKLSGHMVRVNEQSNQDNFPEIIVQDGTLQKVPSYEERECIFVTGASGAGKSTWTGQYAREYKRKYPNNNLVLFCPKLDDPALNELNPIRINLCEQNFIDPETKLNIDELENTLCIFDDIEGIADKQIKDAVQSLRDQILVIGRSKHISCVTISHLITDHKNTRYSIMESQFVVFFPAGGTNMQITRFLKSYCGLDRNAIHRILRETPSRYIILHKMYPFYVIAKDMAYML
jgi:hypothetical protein